MSDHIFFFSYSNKDQSLRLDQFFTELRTAVHQKLGDRDRSLDDVAFRDEENIRLGDNWSTEICSALKESQILVCNYSPHYFKSEYCGKEIGVFQKRLSRQNEKDRKSIIIPVLWETPELCKIPGSLSYLQHKQSDICALYRERGLHWIIKLKKDAEFLEFVDILATTIVQTVNSSKLPIMDGELRLTDIPNAFSKTSYGESLPVNLAESPSANFIFVAGKRSELENHKKNLEMYGTKGQKDWKPFNEDDEIWFIAQNIATKKHLEYNHVNIDEDLINTIKVTEMKSVVIIIVDPWSLKINSYKTQMELYDQINLINSGILVLWKMTDKETINNLDELRTNLQRTFLHCVFGNRADFKGEITSQNDLETILGIAIEEARARIMKYATVFLPPNLASGNTSIPTISGPE